MRFYELVMYSVWNGIRRTSTKSSQGRQDGVGPSPPKTRRHCNVPVSYSEAGVV
jgi:hypothetical protein